MFDTTQLPNNSDDLISKINTGGGRYNERNRKVILRSSKIILHLFARLSEMQALYSILHLHNYLSHPCSVEQADPADRLSCPYLGGDQADSLFKT